MKERKRVTNGRKSNGLQSATRARGEVAGRLARSPFQSVFGENVRRARIRKHLSTEDLAAETGFTADFIKRVETGEVPRLKARDMEAFATALGVDVTSLARRPGSRGA